MIKKWKPTSKLLTLSVVILLQLTIGFVNLTRKSESELTTNTSEALRTVVGYSFEYLIEEELKNGLECDGRVGNVTGRTTKWRHDDNLDLYLLSAFYDVRQDPHHFVRIVGLVPSGASFYCQMWYQHNNTLVPVTQKARISVIWSERWGDPQDKHHPSVISCFVPPQAAHFTGYPRQVSFTSETCTGGSAVLEIAPPRRRRSDGVLVCVKPLHFPDKEIPSFREWIELNYVLGAKKVVVYVDDLNQSDLNILKTFARRRFVEISPFELLPGKNRTIWWKRKMEIIAYNDCFYRHMHRAAFFLPLDVDEMVVPKADDSWRAMLRRNATDDYASYSVRNVYFFEKYPNELPKLVNEPSIFSRTTRSLRFSPDTDSVKSFLHVDNTLTVFNHYAFHVLGRAARQYVFPVEIAQLNHYRRVCDQNLIDGCEDFLRNWTFDDSINRFRARTRL